MIRYDLIVVGAGPAGLSAAIEASKLGMKVAVFDENAQPGGQLIKQVHKFFGSKEHRAKVRGFNIGYDLLYDAEELGVEVYLNATVVGLYMEKEITVRIHDAIFHYKADTIIVATGASENVVSFPGWTLPGVMGAGAAQTMMNLHGLKPGNKILMLGSGNVGLVVGYQLLQAGCEVVAVIDAAPKVGGYGVHASKLARCGVPFYLSHTIQKAIGDESVEGVTIAEVGADWKIVNNSEKYFDVDTICLAVGLTPMAQLLKKAGCKMIDNPKKGGTIPVVDEWSQSSEPGLFVAGDVGGIEEASSAMITGKMAGLAAAHYTGWLERDEFEEKYHEQTQSLESLHQGMFAPNTKGKKITSTDEGFGISDHLLRYGYLDKEEVSKYPGIPDNLSGIHPVIECTQNIPCNPCQDACPKNCIKVCGKITALPQVNKESKCIGCAFCVAACPGQAIFLVDENYDENFASVTIPYEFSPVPQKGMIGMALDRSGSEVCQAEVISTKIAKSFDKTNVISLKVPKKNCHEARFFKVMELTTVKG